MRNPLMKSVCLLTVVALLFGAVACAAPAAGQSAVSNPSADANASTVTEAAASTLAEPAASEAAAVPSPAAEEAAPQVRSFTDSLGRTVELPAVPGKIAVTGPIAQMVLFALCPGRLAGVAVAWNDSAVPYIDEQYLNLPVLGQLYGGKGELNLETLLSSGAEVVVDVGEPKDGIVQDLDDLQEQTQIPFVHITMTSATMGESFRLLGELMGMPDEAEALASYCESVYARVCAIAQSANKPTLLYILGDEGHNVIARGSYHAEIIDLLADNAAVVDSPSSKGTGNEVDAEQLLVWNPDVILVAPDSVYQTMGDDPLMQALTAVQNGTCYEVPFGPYNWMGFPPSVNRLPGMLWLAKLLYPDAADYNLEQEVMTYYELFLHCALTDAQYQSLVADSIGK